MTQNTNITYAFIGAGNMSGAIIGGMVNSGVSPSQIIATNRTEQKQQALKAKFGIKTELNNQQAIQQADVIILGVKPQMMADVLSDLVEGGADFSGKLVITVAAGLLVKRYTDIIGNVRFVRCMPNTPSLVGHGVSGLYLGSDVNKYNASIREQDKQIATELFEHVGAAVWLKSEAEIDQLAAVSGSGPAYFFAFMEAMANKAKAFGFSDDVANIMVQETAIGAAKMTFNKDKSFAELRENVTSPGGSTAAALHVFNDKKLQAIVDEALDAAVTRAQEMSQL
ncbi:pyrroline-5-carboxylate reductase [Psychrosphaera aestuarii]|uniref:pyrroline-5-carboxylate reductase n=1 Tax=Psychrosphaera aestuarii TaxID=1266052 RepID=UPI001B3360BD|nr:pyrroline-5-carboxylate reductase [Psychrosphaera aestuarii]